MRPVITAIALTGLGALLLSHGGKWMDAFYKGEPDPPAVMCILQPPPSAEREGTKTISGETHPGSQLSVPGSHSELASKLPEQLTSETLAAAEVLFESRVFATGLVGVAAQTPSEISAFQSVLKSPHAQPVFELLVVEGTPEAVAYGLCGLYFVDRAAFESHASDGKIVSREVTTQAGCLRWVEPLRSVIGDGQTPHGDIRGGGFPAALRDFSVR